jgi:hypothetical protein
VLSQEAVGNNHEHSWSASRGSGTGRADQRITATR